MRTYSFRAFLNAFSNLGSSTFSSGSHVLYLNGMIKLPVRRVTQETDEKTQITRAVKQLLTLVDSLSISWSTRVCPIFNTQTQFNRLWTSYHVWKCFDCLLTSLTRDFRIVSAAKIPLFLQGLFISAWTDDPSVCAFIVKIAEG